MKAIAQTTEGMSVETSGRVEVGGQVDGTNDHPANP
jgi:hypothetical protein